jgi:hypothetical protein
VLTAYTHAAVAISFQRPGETVERRKRRTVFGNQDAIGQQFLPELGSVRATDLHHVQTVQPSPSAC